MKNLIYSMRSKLHNYLESKGIPFYKAVMVAYVLDMIIVSVITYLVTYSYFSSVCK